MRPGKTLSLKVAAAVKILAGVLVAVNASGYAVPASDTEGLKVIGKAYVTVDNSAGSAGDASVIVERGTFRFANSTTHALAQANIGGFAYVEDDAVVAGETTNGVIAGIVLEIEDCGVWVDTTLAPALKN